MADISLENKTVLVTGAAGFIGSFLSKRLLETYKGITVIGIDSITDYYEIETEQEEETLSGIQKTSHKKSGLYKKKNILLHQFR